MSKGYAVAACVIGFWVFAPCWVKLRSMRDYGQAWKNRINMAGIIGGLLLFSFGLYIAEQ